MDMSDALVPERSDGGGCCGYLVAIGAAVVSVVIVIVLEYAWAYPTLGFGQVLHNVFNALRNFPRGGAG
ncbi:MAG TPA: hypothetical protein VIM84_10390 [Gemmatimonadales bacterium]